MMAVTTLADCLQCGRRYVIVPGPQLPVQWTFFDRDQADYEHPTHVCVGGMLCVNGHELDIVAPQAALTREGDWLRLEPVDAAIVMN